MRRLPLATCLIALVLLGAACGDGVDERYDAGAPAPSTTEPASTTTSTIALTRPAISTMRTTLKGSRATYSGARSVVHLHDGSWLLSGYDNHTERQPEPGAVWHSTDLATWTRVGKGISDEQNQQSITALVETGDTVVAVGGTFARNGKDFSQITDPADLLFDADSWYSTNGGTSFTEVLVEQNAGVSGVREIDGALLAWGFHIVGGVAQGAFWTSHDRGRSWKGTSPTASPSIGAPSQPLGPIRHVLSWGDSLVAIGFTTATDPDGASKPLDLLAFVDGAVSTDPLDVAIWLSDDAGAHWRATAGGGLAGLPGAQYVSSALVLDDRLVMLGGAVDPDTVDPTSSSTTVPSFAASGGFQTVLWVCDFQLARCDDTVLVQDGVDVVGSTMVATGHQVTAVVSTANYDGGTTVHALHIDPATGSDRSVSIAADIDQVETIAVDGAHVLIFGRSPYTNQLEVAKL